MKFLKDTVKEYMDKVAEHEAKQAQSEEMLDDIMEGLSMENTTNISSSAGRKWIGMYLTCVIYLSRHIGWGLYIHV